MDVTIITPTTGNPHLTHCIRSVAEQRHPAVKQLVVIDGKEREHAARSILEQANFHGDAVVLPNVTGRDGYFGHRVYGAIPFIAATRYVCFLDEDNFLEPDHVERLVALVEGANLEWGYSLRSIVNADGNFMMRDNCQSLGWWPAYDGLYQHIDTSCYLLKREIAIESSFLWNRKGYTKGIRDPDRELCRWLIYHHPVFFTTGAYTLNYRLGTSLPQQQVQSFFQLGNVIHGDVYKIFPWQCTEPGTGITEQLHLSIRAKPATELAGIVKAAVAKRGSRSQN